MRILLVNPRFPDSIWGFDRIHKLTGTRFSFAPLALPTLAALTPPEHEVVICDENVEKLDLDAECDLVGITAFNLQIERAFEIADAFRSRGIRVAVGGPYATMCPEECAPHVDHLFVGEAERTWPRFLEDLEAGTARPEYRQEERVPLDESPVPRFELLKLKRYNVITVQTSRGCPHQCEFCDVPILMGRPPRLKSTGQVLAEVKAIYDLGASAVLFTDDNFIGNRKRVKETLRALSAFNDRRRRRMSFRAEMTLDVARDEELLQLLVDANFESVYLGIETPRHASLLEAGKGQNSRHPMLEEIRKIQSRGIVVWAGMIVGFDHDDLAIFREQFDFLMEANIPVTTVGVLVAPPRTPLADRLAREGRLLPWNKRKVQGHMGAITNVDPLGMTTEQLQAGYDWLIRSLYSRRNYVKRLLGSLDLYPRSLRGLRLRWPTLRDIRTNWKDLRISLRLVRELLFHGDWELRGLVLRVVGRAIGRGRGALAQAISYLVMFRHVHGFVNDSFGNPETAPALDPYHGFLAKQGAVMAAGSGGGTTEEGR